MTFDTADHESDDSVNSNDANTSRGVGDANVDDVMVDRPDDEDHDLLTFGEAGARLEEEVIKQRRIIALLRQGGGDDAAIEGAQRRLDSLEAARTRNSPPSIDDLKTAGFFGPRS